MDAEDKLGQVTAAVGSVCLRFKREPDAPLPQGHVFVKCTFVGRGGPLFVPATPGADSEVPAAVDNAAGSPLLPLPSVKSDAIDITEVIAAAAVGDDAANEEEATVAAAVADAVVADTAHVVTVDMGFSLDTIKFDLAEHALSMLGATEMKIELCFRSAGSADDTETVMGMASVRVAAILSGNNEWTDELTLGTYAVVAPEEATTGSKSQVDGKPTAEAVDDDVPPTEAVAAGQDVSLGPLEFGGSTSTIRVTLLTNDDTADYTVGAGSLWVDGAEVTGLPEEWKIVPPPETERSAWNESIAQILADEESVHVASATGNSAEDAGSQGQTSAFASSRGGGRGASASGSSRGSKEAEPTPPVPWDPPTGTWSVRFPSFHTKSTFLHRTCIRELRRSLSKPLQSKPLQGDSSEINCNGIAPEGRKNVTTLPVFLERRELRPEPTVDEGKTGGRGAKKGGKKTPAGKKGEAPEPPLQPPETPWLCRAVIDLSPLVQPGAASGDPGGASKSKIGDSPVQAELTAKLALASHSKNDAAPPDSNAPKGDGTATQASEVVAPAAEGVGPDDVAGESGESPTISQTERRIEQMRAAQTTLFVTFALSRPLVKATARQETKVSVSDVLVRSDVGPRKPPRDVDVELKEEIDEFVNASLAEYAKLFLEPGAEEHSQNMSAEDREKHLFYALNSGGLYHSFLERLKPRVQRIVRRRFGAVPADAAEADAFISDLYVHLVEEAAVVLNHRITNVETKATPSYITADADISLSERVEHLGMLADDAEARGAREEAAARHADRIEAATAAAASLEECRMLLAQSWEAYGLFSLRGGRSGQHQQRQARYSAPTAGTSSSNDNGNDCNNGDIGSNDGNTTTLAHAARCLEESLRVYVPGSEEFLAAMSLLAAVSMEQGQLDRAWALLETVLEQRLPKLEEGADGYETDDLAHLIPRRIHALRCILRDSMAASCTAGAIASDDEPGAPRRTAVRVMQDACAWLLELGLPGIARLAFRVAEESERLAVKKAKERGLPTRTPTTLRESSRRLQSYLILAEAASALATDGGDNVSSSSSGAAPSKPADLTPEAPEVEMKAFAQIDAPVPHQESSAPEDVGMTRREEVAERLAQEAVELAPGDPRPWQALAEACDAQGPVKATEAADAWAKVLDFMEEAWMTSSKGDNVGADSTAPVPPLRVYMRLGALYATLGRIEEAKWQEAEDALQHASRLDCNSPLVWGHLALLLLSIGEDRLQEADRALSQALRLGLADPSLLREIGNCYVAIGRLDAAEDVLRKSLASDTSGTGVGGAGGGGGVGNPHTRRCLADVLSAKNSTSQAIEEYRRVLESTAPDVDDAERQEVLARCGTLLRKTGRGDELDLLQKETLSSQRSHMSAN
eukprot:g14296.t1